MKGRGRGMGKRALVLAGLLLLAGCSKPLESPEVKPLPKNIRFQWVLSEPLVETNANVVDIDAFDSSKEEVQRLKKQGKIVIAYVSVGSWEDWRPDADKFPKEVIGREYPGWDGERFLNIKRLDLLGPIIEARLDMIKEKGFDGIEPDNIDLHTWNTGFNITKEDVVRYYEWLSREAHKRGLSIAQKNAPDLSLELVNYSEWILLESGFDTEEYREALVYLERNKRFVDVEYTDETTLSEFHGTICPKAKSLGIHVILKNRDLDNWVEYCD